MCALNPNLAKGTKIARAGPDNSDDSKEFARGLAYMHIQIVWACDCMEAFGNTYVNIGLLSMIEHLQDKELSFCLHFSPHQHDQN